MTKSQIHISFAILSKKSVTKNSKIINYWISMLFFLFTSSLNAQKDISKLLDSLALSTKDSMKVRLSQRIAYELKDTDWNRALHYISYSEKLAKKTDSEELIAENNEKIGDIYNEKDALDISLTYFLKAYEYYSQNSNSIKKYHLENSLAIIYARLNNSKQALHYFNKLVKYHTQKNNKLYLAKAYNNIGNLYSSDGKLDSAMVYFKKSLQLNQKIKDKQLSVILYNNLGLINAKQEKYVEAKQFFTKSLKLSDHTTNYKNKAWIYNSLSQLFLLKKEADSALYYSKKATQILKDAKYSFQNNDAIANTYKAYLLKKDYKNAAQYFEMSNEIRDSLNIEMKAMNVEKLKLDQQYKENEEIRILKESEAKFKYYIIAFSFIIALLVLSILLLRYKNKLSHTKLEKEMFEANLELKEKELVTKSMMEIQRTEIVEQILDELRLLKSQATKTETKQTFDEIIKQLDKNKKNDVWEEFEMRYSHVYESFYNILNEKHPELTYRDKRLCALLKLNLTTKEIAQITGQSTKSLENARTRLRKKLQLTNTHQDLITYLENLN